MTDWYSMQILTAPYGISSRIPVPPLTSEFKAQALFFRFLTEDQKQEYLKNKSITVKGNDGGIYRITCKEPHITANIIRLEKTWNLNLFWKKYTFHDKKEVRFCCHIYGDIAFYPAFDHFLAQKILIERDEKRFLQTAFRSSA